MKAGRFGTTLTEKRLFTVPDLPAKVQSATCVPVIVTVPFGWATLTCVFVHVPVTSPAMMPWNIKFKKTFPPACWPLMDVGLPMKVMCATVDVDA
jgi:hypothetical protein